MRKHNKSNKNISYFRIIFSWLIILFVLLIPYFPIIYIFEILLQKYNYNMSKLKKYIIKYILFIIYIVLCIYMLSYLDNI